MSLDVKNITLDQLLDNSAKDLTAFKATLNLAIAEKAEQEKVALKEKLASIASEAGYSLDELTKTKTKKKPSSPLYQNPDDKKETWSGRGRKPNWLLTQIEAGKTLEDFKIN